MTPIKNPEALRCGGVYVEGAAHSQGTVLECVDEFFTRHGVRDRETAAKLDSSAWIAGGALGVAIAPPALVGDRTWIAIADSAPRECSAWVPALAAHCHARLGVDVFWYWTAPKKLGVADSGWCMAGAAPKASHAWKGVAAAVAGFPRPYFAWSDDDGALRASFTIAKDAFLHDLEFAPPVPAKAAAVPKPATAKTAAAKSAAPKPTAATPSSDGMSWFPAAEKRVRPFGAEGPAPKPPTAPVLAGIYAAATAHFDYRLTMFPTLPPDPDGLQAEVVAGWRRGDPGVGTPEVEAASLVLLYRILHEADQKPDVAIETLVDRLAAIHGVVAATEILLRAWALENAEPAAAPAWWILGQLSPPVGLAPDAWFALRRWVGHADADTRRRALDVVVDRPDPRLRCAAALAFPTEASLWRPHLAALSVRGVAAGTKQGRAAHRSLTCLVACVSDLATASELFAAHAEVANSEEYPTLARALGAAGLDLIAAQAPTDLEAMKARALALAVYLSPNAAAELVRAGARGKAVQKIVDDYFKRNPAQAS